MAMVARSMTRSEVMQNEGAKAALQKEWDGLANAKYTDVDGKQKRGVWDESRVMEYADLKRATNKAGKTIHIGRIFDICVEKGYELPKGHPDRKWKGRVVFGGNDVWTQNRDVAIFQDMASQPASMEASSCADCYGTMKGHIIMQADATQAYIQSLLSGIETWVRLPKRPWPE